MDNYIKGETRIVEDDPSPISTDENAVHMKVKEGSKIRNLVGYAMKKIKEPGINQITWNASGLAVSKAVSCTEIMKRKVKNLHQITKVYFKREEDYWEPQIEGLERLCVCKNIPAITVLLSKKDLDSAEPGYQPPEPFNKFWKNNAVDEQKKKDQRKKKTHLSDSSPYDPPTMVHKRKKVKDTKDYRSANKGVGKSTTKMSVAEGKQLKTAQNDNVKALDNSKKQTVDNKETEDL